LRRLRCDRIVVRNLPGRAGGKAGSYRGYTVRINMVLMRFRVLLPLCLIACPAFAQLTSFPRPNYFRETFSKNVPRVELQAPARLQDAVVSGKLELSLRTYIELVVANNTDVAMQKLSIETGKNAVLRAFSPFDPIATARFNNTRNTSTPTQRIDLLRSPDPLITVNQPALFNYTQLLQNG